MMITPPARTLLASLAFVALISCGKPVSSSSNKTVTYYKNVEPIFAANCVGCHSPNNIGPIDLTGFAGAKANASLIASATASRIMPPWMPGPDTLPMDHARQLSSADIQTIQDWVAGGAQEGSAADMPKQSGQQQAMRVDVQMQIPQPYSPDLSLGTDDYRCFVLDPHLATQEAVTAFNILPGEAAIVHHVILYNIPGKDLSQVQALENEDPREGYSCFGDSRIGDQRMVGGWAPGTPSTFLPSGTGVYLDAGSLIVMQVHYNTLYTKQGSDQTTMQLQLAPAASVTQAYMFPILDSDFSVPPGVTQKVIKTFDTSTLNIPDGITIKVFGSFPHMHLHGTSIQVTDDTIDHQHLTLMHIPKWDFHWQQFYFYQTPVTVQKGDVITLECDYDNTAADQPIINGMQETPKTLQWGEGTLDEMCLNFFYATIQ